jgi:hypothetical protein
MMTRMVSRILTKLKDNFEMKYLKNPVSENSDTGFFMVKFL